MREVDAESGLIRVTEIRLDVYVAYNPDLEVKVDLNAEPLIARVLSFSQTGNLTIVFNKPFRMPKL